MGLMKRMLENQESQRVEAVEIAVAGGAISRCEFHDEITINNWTDPSEAYKIANARFSAGELTAEWESRRELTDTIKAVIEESLDECPLCERALAD